jgi:hypothetical protein
MDSTQSTVPAVKFINSNSEGLLHANLQQVEVSDPWFSLLNNNLEVFVGSVLSFTCAVHMLLVEKALLFLLQTEVLLQGHWTQENSQMEPTSSYLQ